MRAHRKGPAPWALALVFGVCLLLILLSGRSPQIERQAEAAGSATALMTNQAAAGVGLASVSTNPTPGETGAERHSFAYHASAARIAVELQRSNDGGTTWATIHTFTGRPTQTRTGLDEVWPAEGLPACGVCSFRAWKPATTTGTASVSHVVSGAALPLALTYTPTNTPTNTPTAPTPTPTRTQTPTRTPTATKTSTPTSTPGSPPLTRTPTPTRTPTRTPLAPRTATPTRTPTRTQTPTMTPT